MEDVALTLQRSLLPRELPDVLGAELCGRYVPASESLEIGGDFYDATALGDGRVVITIGDVAGHGVLAAAVMGQVRQAVRAYAFEGHPPAALMDRLDLLVSDSDLAMTTLPVRDLRPGHRTCCASPTPAHPPPLIRRADGTVERVTDGLSHPLGVTMTHRHVEAASRSGTGDALLLYTDGLVERRGARSSTSGSTGWPRDLAEGSAVAAEACERIVSDLDDNLRPTTPRSWPSPACRWPGSACTRWSPRTRTGSRTCAGGWPPGCRPTAPRVRRPTTSCSPRTRPR